MDKGNVKQFKEEKTWMVNKKKWKMVKFTSTKGNTN